MRLQMVELEMWTPQFIFHQISHGPYCLWWKTKDNIRELAAFVIITTIEYPYINLNYVPYKTRLYCLFISPTTSPNVTQLNERRKPPMAVHLKAVLYTQTWRPSCVVRSFTRNTWLNGAVYLCVCIYPTFTSFTVCDGLGGVPVEALLTVVTVSSRRVVSTLDTHTSASPPRQ